MIKQLGKVSDQVIAEELGIKRGRVASYRHRHQIPAIFSERFRWTKRDLAKLGTMPDNRLSKALGIAVNTIATKRKTLGIPSYSSSRK